jgi:hypothetical protein
VVGIVGLDDDLTTLKEEKVKDFETWINAVLAELPKE